ncbi:MAG: LuxR C-terminal-related transcriptional regulator, partial [Chloroflexota bacterium]
AILKALGSANLLLLSLDQEERWFRYHHLLRDLLQHQLRQRHGSETIKILHSRASQWFEDNGFIEEALSHAFSAGDLDRAAQIVSRQRYRLMNQTSWPQLERYLRRFPSWFTRQQPDLLMLKAWLFHHSGNYEELPEVLVKIETAMAQSALSLEAMRHLKGEMSALVSLVSYYGLDGEQTLTAADFSIKNTPPELWVIRILARLFLAGSYQMRGELNRAYEIIFRATEEEDNQSNRFRAPTMMTSCYIYWLAADLNGLMQVAKQCLELFDYHHSVEFEGFVHYHLGCAHLQRLELSAAEEQFEVVVKDPYLNYGECYAHSAFGLSLTYLAQGRAKDARQVASTVVDFAIETTNSTILFLAIAFQAEIALREGQLATAGQWADQFETVPPLLAMVQLYQYQLTLVRIWLAYDSPGMRRRAADLLGKMELYAESTHNSLFLIEVKALLAVLYAAEDDIPAALAQLEGATALAQPGGIIRTFVDLGPPMADLLHTLHGQGVSSDYRSQYLIQIMSAFTGAALGQNQLGASVRPESAQVLADPLTTREVEVLEFLAQRLTNKEIAEKLFIAPGTVKTHTLSIYAKLQVAGRRQAVEKAIQIGLLSSG